MEKEKQTIKEIYKDLEEVVKLNPQLYIMPTSLWNEIFKKMQYLERALKQARESRDNYKSKYQELKNGS